MRGLGHKKDEEATRQTNAMVQHNTLYHKGEQEDYQMSVIALHDEPVGKRLREGVEIVAGNHSPQFNEGIFARSCTKHKNSERIWLVKLANSMLLSNLNF